MWSLIYRHYSSENSDTTRITYWCYCGSAFSCWLVSYWFACHLCMPLTPTVHIILLCQQLISFCREWRVLLMTLMLPRVRCRSSVRWFCRRWCPAWMTRMTSTTWSLWRRWAACRGSSAKSPRMTYRPYSSTSPSASDHALRRSVTNLE